MLAILVIQMTWHKKEKGPGYAAARQKYYRPIQIEEGVDLSGSGIFLVKCGYDQNGNTIVSDWEASDALDKEIREEGRGRAFSGDDEREQKRAIRRAKSIQKTKGAFYEPEKVNIPCIAIVPEERGCYRIKWYDSGKGMPRRRGGNEDCYKEGARLAGRPNTLNETAFILEEGEAGMLEYNFRCASLETQWYECYNVYMVNKKELDRDIFLRDYMYRYRQMADLF